MDLYHKILKYFMDLSDLKGLYEFLTNIQTNLKGFYEFLANIQNYKNK